MKVSHPHAQSLEADAFSLGVVRPTTDYNVYVCGGLRGLDAAF